MTARELVARCAALTLDVFDTALLRLVDEPHAVFALVGARYRHEHPDAPQLDFAAARISAEQRARLVGYARTKHHEVTVDQIYAALQVPAGWDRTTLRRLELELEAELLVRNPYIHALYEAAVERDIPIAFLSDMYLPASFIEAALDRAGYDRRTFVLVSSENEGATKGTGALYERAASRLAVRRGEILHIGDNEHSDVTMARRAGYEAWHYRRAGDLATRSGAVHPGRSDSAAIVRGLIHNALWADRDATPSGAYARGFRSLGLLWHHEDGDERAIRDALTRWNAQRWLALLDGDEGLDLRRGARDFHAAMARVRVALPWLSLPAVDALLALGGVAATTRRGVPTDELERLRFLNAEYLAGWAESERREPKPAVAHARVVEEWTRELEAFRRRFAPPTSLRAQAFDWTLRRACDATKVASMALDVRDALVAQLRRVK